jgi:uncharacterized protein (DUF2252 family)
MNIHDCTKSFERWLRRETRVVPADLQLKHRRLRESPFVFLRGTFYRWIQQWPEACREIADAPQVLAVGDLHVENFGTWRDAESRLVWGINDVDEAWRLPYTQDLTRLATSALLAIEAGHFALSGREACDAILDGYRRAVTTGGRPFVLAERRRWLRDAAMSELRDPTRFWAHLDGLPTVRQGVPREVLRTAMPGRIHPERVVHRIAGMGSLGRQRFVALATIHGALVAREAKALVPSAFLWATGRPSAPPACATILSRAIRDPDPYFAVQDGWIVRRLSPDCSRVEIQQLAEERDEWKLLRAMGAETANLHLGSDRKRIMADLRRRPDRWLERSARKMAGLVEKDWRAWAR